jgi:environmental stress-induced protein Ves
MGTLMPWRLLPAREFRAMPWRNGGGTTWEIARGRLDGVADGEAEGGDWHWRFSLAEIAADGPFSVFPHIDRWLVVVAGEGIALTVEGAAPRRLHRGDDIQFPGEADIGCVLLAGPTRDLNLMVDRRVARLVPGGDERRIAAVEDGVTLLYALEEVGLEIETEVGTKVGAGRMVIAAGDALMGGGVGAVIAQGRALWARVERLAAR